jgi:predicted phage terminase large subunit-like protein
VGSPALDISQEEARVSALRKGFEDPVWFCKFFLPHLFPGTIPWVHRGLLSILTGRVDFLHTYGEIEKIRRNFVWEDADGETHSMFQYDDEGNLQVYRGKYTLIMMPRGAAKTTIAGVAVPLYEILNQECGFQVYISHAMPHSKMQLNNVKRELTDNGRIQGVFGEMKPGLRDEEKWSEEMFENTRGIAMAARGRGGQIRGLLHRGQRPKKIIIDDLEDKDSVSTQLQRSKTREWAYADMMPALPPLDPDGTIIALGTMLHKEDLLSVWGQDPDWTVVKFGVWDRDGEPLWPEYMDEEKIAAKKRSYSVAGQLHNYYMEYENEPQAAETQVFKPEHFLYEPVPEGDGFYIQNAIYIDPAISPRRTADKTAIIVAGMAKNGLIYVQEVVAKRGMNETEKIDTYFRLHQKYQCRRAGVESVAYQASLIHHLREAMFRKGHYFEIDAIPHKTKKTSRIVGILAGRFNSGYIRFVRRFPDLEVELMDFRPDTDDQPDDCADALAGVVALLDPFAAEAAGDVDLTADEYEPLDSVMDGEWRSA